MKAITRLAKATALGLTLAALVLPAARADDWYRDIRDVATTIVPGNFYGDDRFHDARPVLAAATRTLPANDGDGSRIAAAQATPGLDWADFSLGAGSMFGALLLLAVFTGGLLLRRGRRMLSRT